MKKIKLSATNHEIPIIGLGTWQAQPKDIETAINIALESGYRLIDTAFNYNNEEIIGKIIKQWIDEKKIDRSELFITTKLPNVANRASDVEKYLKLSLEKLQLSYIDLYLIHVPFGFICDEKTLSPNILPNGDFELDMMTDHISTWKAMEKAKKKGLTKNIGLSNFNEKQIDKICQDCTIKPQVLQVECHAYLQQASLREYCARNNIVVTAYSPLGSPGSQKHFTTKYNYSLKYFPDIIGHSIVRQLSTKHAKSPAQILLRYLTQINIVVIPKSCNPMRIEENIKIFDFELDSTDMQSLKELDQDEEGRIIDFNFWKGVEKHPEYPFIVKA